MTVASETARQRHNGNGATTLFTTGFIFQANSHVRVIYTDADDVDTEWVENTQYTLTGADTGSNGTVTIITAPTDYTPASGTHITIIRDVPFTQTLDGTVLSTMSAEDQEAALDKIWMGMGQLKEWISRALVSDETGDGGVPSTASWLPEFSIESDGARRCLKIVGWTGGTGSEPDSGLYVGTTGLVAAIGDAVDIRGPTGANGSGTGDLLAANNLSDVGSVATAFSTIKQAATTSATGVVELATDAEAQAGVDTSRAITAANLQAVTATETRKGVVELATTAEASTGTDTARAVTPAGLAAYATAHSEFPAGTAMLFVQTAAPTGWTKSTTHDNKALRVVSGTASSGGSVNFSTLFGRTATDAVTLIPANLPANTMRYVGTGGTVSLTESGETVDVSTAAGTSFSPQIDMRVKYVDVVICTKD